jgi:tetratricopeptide (TPR) repeat protein
MGRCYSELGDHGAAERAFMLGASEAPQTREPWCELAMLTYRQSRWEESFAYAMRALKIVDRTKVYTCDPAVWGSQPHDLAAVAAWNLGLKEIALAQARLALSHDPDDARLQSNVRWMSGDATLSEAA